MQEFFFDDLTELVYPDIDFFYFFEFQTVVDLPALLLRNQEVTFIQNAQMLGYGLAGDVEMFRNGVGRHRVYGDQDEDRPPGGVCNSLKNVASHGIKYEADWLQIYMQPIGFAKFIFKRDVSLGEIHRIWAAAEMELIIINN